jgi:LmbE family N-acetylglucosaminyl deacetylase
MKPTPIIPVEPGPLLAFGAHPDDIEFGCGGVLVREAQAGRAVHLAVCSRGEAGTYGSAEQRSREAEAAAQVLGARLEFVELEGDAHLQVRVEHAIKLAGVLRRIRPGIVLAPTLVENQHPDHARLGKLVRDATRLARYGGIQELRAWQPHSIEALYYYALTPDAEPRDITPVLVDVSAAEVVATWTAAMEAHASQTRAREYVKMQLTRAQMHGLRAGLSHAIALYPNDAVVIGTLGQLGRGARRF